MAGLPLKRCIGVRLLLALVVMLAVPAAQAGFFDLRSMRYMIAEKRCDELATRLTALLPEADGEILQFAAQIHDADPSSSSPAFGMHSFLWFYGFNTLLEFGRPPVPDARWGMQYEFEVEEGIRASSIPIQVGVSQ